MERSGLFAKTGGSVYSIPDVRMELARGCNTRLCEEKA
jgi:hypothetical protein